jgi:hypothetical protein
MKCSDSALAGAEVEVFLHLGIVLVLDGMGSEFDTDVGAALGALPPRLPVSLQS